MEVKMSITLTTPATNTYKLHYTKNKISGFTNRRNALEQSIYCLLNTERYKYVIYSFNYGIQREDLYGKSIDNAILKLQYRISNALNADDSINSVTNFEFDSKERGVLKVKFIVNSIYGEIEINYEFNI